MEMYVAIFCGGLVVGIIIAYAVRAALKQQLIAATDCLKHELQSIQQLQNDKLLLQQQKEDIIGRALYAEGATKILQLEFENYQLLQIEHQTIKTKTAVLQTQLEIAAEKLATQQLELEMMGEKLRSEFRNLAQSILDEKTAKFTQVNEEKMKAILDPLKNEIVDFKKKVDDTYDKESKERFTLGKEVQRLIEMSQLVSQEANNLTSALKGNNKQQGNWGEMILESILSYSGLTKGREFVTQDFIRDNAGNVIKDEHGRGLQPDVTVIYPDQRKIIIDAKVSLIAWDQYVAEEDIDTQKTYLKSHIQSIKTHIDVLSKKNYPQYADALDYVLMFIPIEPAFLEAVKTDLHLWKYAYEKKIMLVSATNLLAVLKIISELWRVEQQNLHAISIANKAGALYDKFVGFIDNLELVGKKINDAQVSYENAFKQLSGGKGNMINRMEELKKIGANANKQLPERILPQIQNGDQEF